MPDQETLSERQVTAGSNHVANVLQFHEACSPGGNAASLFASGMLGGARDFLIKKHGPRAVYDVVQNMADEIAATIFSAENIEAEVKAIAASLRKAAEPKK